MAEIIMRDYQTQIIDQTRQLMRQGHKSILIQLSTGAGKTVIASYMLKSALNKGMRAYFGCHRVELIRQTIRTLANFEVPCGVISAGFQSEPQQNIQVCSIPTLFRRLSKVQEPNLFFWDEARFIGAKTWTNIYKAFPNSYHVLLDATPVRMDGKALGEYATALVRGPEMRWLIDAGFLSDYRAFAPSGVDTSGIKKSMGDFQKTQLDELMDKPTITGNAVKEYIKIANGKSAVVFCVSINHSEHVASAFRSAGVSAAHVDGNTHPSDRKQIMNDFASGRTKVLTNVDIASCGLDIPKMEAVILLRPTQSLSLYLQQVGRVLRPAPGKTHAIILDHANNIEHHGLPDDERTWSLEGRAGRQAIQKSEPGIKVCSFCFAAQPMGSSTCRHCDQLFEKKDREILEVDGELTEIDRARKKARQQQGQSQSLEELYQLGLRRGYKNARRWAHYVYQARQNKRNRGAG